MRLAAGVQSVRLLVFAAVLGLSFHGHAQQPAPVVAQDQGPAIVANSSTFDFTSAINGRAYRLFVSVPPGFKASETYGVLYVLDGNQYFGTATEAVARQSFLRTIKPVIVVGIGYPSGEFAVGTRERWFDLTHQASLPSQRSVREKTGGGVLFQRVLLEEIRPFVGARWHVDPGAQAIWGQSLAGLFALQLLLERPDAFAAFAVSSPSIWWNNKEALRGLDDFGTRLGRSPSTVRVLVTSAADEQPRSMVDDASSLALELARASPSRLTVSRVSFEGEVHNSVSQASLSRTLRVFFAPEPADKR